MKSFGILLVAACSAVCGMAQETNLTSTNVDVRDAIFIQMTNAIAKDIISPTNVREMSLDDCIQIALEHNYTIRINRFNPALTRYTLWGSYSVYDPDFTASYDHQYSLSPSGIDAQGRPFAGTESEGDRIDTGIAGMLPWGLNYNLGLNTSDQTVKRPTLLVNTNLITGYSTNIFFDVNTNPVIFLNPTFATKPGTLTVENSSVTAGALTLSQPLLRNFWIDADRFTIYVNKKEVQKSEADFRDTLMSTVTQVETAYLKLIQAQENVEVQRKALELADSTLSENRKRVEVGAMAPLDEQQAESQAATSRAALLQAVSAEGTQQRVLKSLLSDNYTNEWFNVLIKPKDKLVAIPQQFNLQESWRKALAYGGSPVRLQQLRLTLQENEARVRTQRNQLFPELDVTGSYGYSGGAKELSGAFGQIQNQSAPFWSVGVQLSVPLSQTAARNNLKAAKASRDQQKLTIEQQEQNTLITIENDIASIRTDYETVQATHEATLYAESALKAEQTKFNNGKSTLFTVLGLQSQLTAARSNEINALATYNVDLSTFSYDEGSTFERLKLDLKME